MNCVNREEKDPSGDGDDDDDEEEKKGVKLARPQKGDYMIQVHVIEARELKGRDFGDTSDPMCEISVMGQKKCTAIHKESLNVIFDERVHFSHKGLEPEELNQGRCTIDVYDANMIRRNVLIGSFEFDLLSIYYMEHHELFMQWVALTDVTDANEGVQGYLQVSISVLGPKDEMYIHDPSELLSLDGGLLNVMMPPQIEQEPRLLSIHIYELDKLAIMDKLTKSSDPYVEVSFAAVTNKTSVFKKSLYCQVLETITLPVMEPILGDTIMVYVKDHDVVRTYGIVSPLPFFFGLCG